jgi:protein-L-isoaspartate(D-aspartate) O-methyltransferase
MTGTTREGASELGRPRQLLLRQLYDRGIRDARVLEALRRVPREQFVPPELRALAYADRALPIGDGQTISQPYVVARTLQALELRGHESVLEVGTGSGYVAALLSELAHEVYSMERLESLASRARQRLLQGGYRVHVLVGDGSLGWPSSAPYEAIAVAACGPSIPSALLGQLAPHGRLVLPVRHDDTEHLVCVRRAAAEDFSTEFLEEVRFVPLIGAQGVSEWPAS